MRVSSKNVHSSAIVKKLCSIRPCEAVLISSVPSKLLELSWDVLPHPAYAPDLALSYFYLSRSIQNSMNGVTFNTFFNFRQRRRKNSQGAPRCSLTCIAYTASRLQSTGMALLRESKTSSSITRVMQLPRSLQNITSTKASLELHLPWFCWTHQAVLLLGCRWRQWYKDRKMTRSTTVRTLEIFEGVRALCGMCSTIIMEHNSSYRNCKNIASRKDIEHIISGQMAKSSDSLTWPRWNSIKRTPTRNSLNFFIVATTYRRMLPLENIRVSWIAKWCLFLTITWCLVHWLP